MQVHPCSSWTLRSALAGSIVAILCWTTSAGAQVPVRYTTLLVFHFKDGSLHDETELYSQRQSFRLISDHIVQKGPTFPQPIDMTIDGAKGQVTVRYTTDKGEQKVESATLKPGLDFANGLILTLLKNANPQSPPAKLGFVAATPKPQVVKLEVS